MFFQNQWLDDLAKLAMGAIQVGKAVCDEVKLHAKDQVNQCADRMGFVRREEFDLMRERLEILEQNQSRPKKRPSAK